MDIQAYRGDDFEIAITVLDSAGDPFDLTDCTLLIDVKDSIDNAATANESNALISKTQACTDDPTSGVQSVSFIPTDTESLEANHTYAIGVKLISSAGKRYTLGVNQLFLASEVVRRGS